MSRNQSNLSHLPNLTNGYDFVLATTQESINATMKKFLAETYFPVVKMYFVSKEDKTIGEISFEELMSKTSNIDPLALDNWNDNEDKPDELKKFKGSHFQYAFEASIGIPTDMDLKDVNDIVVLNQNSNIITFTLMCSDFTIVKFTYGEDGLEEVHKIIQPSEKPWLFTSSIQLNTLNIKNDPEKSFLNDIPKDISDALDKLKLNDFSIKQLFIDLATAELDTTPQIPNLAEGDPIKASLNTVFLGAYFNVLKDNKLPVLNYTIVHHKEDLHSTLHVTNRDFGISSYKNPDTQNYDTPTLNTLNYLCEIDNNPKLDVKLPFSWNWVEKSDMESFHGVVAINKNTFVKYIHNKIFNQIKKCCIQPWVTCEGDDFLYIKYGWQLFPDQTPNIEFKDSGSEVITYSYKCLEKNAEGRKIHDESWNGGIFDLSSSFDASVKFDKNTIEITQHLKINAYVSQSLGVDETWVPVDKTLTDVYTLSIDNQGHLIYQITSTPCDNSITPPTRKFDVFDSNSLSNSISSSITNFANFQLHDLQIDSPQHFVFPGGKAFTYKDVSFSDNQDLISCITYII